MDEQEFEQGVRRTAELILESKHSVVFTGAGISTESGIPDFRSPGGIWERYTPIYYHQFLSSHEAPKRSHHRVRGPQAASDLLPRAEREVLPAELERLG